ETSPIPKLIERIEEKGGIVLNPMTAEIDQPNGVRKAIELGYKKIGVTVANAYSASISREIEKENGVDVITFGVHLTGMEKDEAEKFLNLVDLTTGCTSKWIRLLVQDKTILQTGTSVPIFALTQRGKELLIERAKEVTDTILLNTMKLPVLPEEKQPRPLI
ncbi:MAG: DUF2099 family protein, partial [Methanosarcinales archaeon]